MKLLGIPLSPFVRKVAVVLAIKDLPFEQEPVMPGAADPDFKALSPLGKIPVLMSFLFDMKILFMTFFNVLSSKGIMH